MTEKEQSPSIKTLEVIYTPVDVTELQMYLNGEDNEARPVMTDEIQLKTNPLSEDRRFNIIHHSPLYMHITPGKIIVGRSHKLARSKTVVVFPNNKQFPTASRIGDDQPYARLSNRKPIALIVHTAAKRAVLRIVQESQYPNTKIFSQKEWIKVREGEQSI